jgi:hypothetical protein
VRSFIAVRERFRADPSIWRDAPYANTQSLYVLGRIVTPEEIRRGAIELAVERGSLEVQLSRPGGASFEPGTKFNLSYAGFFPDWSVTRMLPQISNINGIILPVPADGRLRFGAIPAGSYRLYLFLPGEGGAAGTPIEVKNEGVTKFELKLDR